MLIFSIIFICLLFNSTTQSLIIQYFTAEVCGYRSSLILKFFLAFQLTGRQANFPLELPVALLLDKKQNRNLLVILIQLLLRHLIFQLYSQTVFCLFSCLVVTFKLFFKQLYLKMLFWGRLQSFGNILYSISRRLFYVQ